MSTEDAGYKKFFDEMIASPASPELNLLSDEIEVVDAADQSDVIPAYHPPLFPLAHPILHRLQPLGAPPVNMIKAHVLSQAPVVSQATVGGGISPTLTWSGGPSPIEKETSPTFQDFDDFVHVKAEPEIDHWSSALFSEGSLAPNPPSIATRKTRRDSSATSASSTKRSSRNSSRHSRSRSAHNDSGAEDEDLNLSIVSGSTRIDPDSPPLGSAPLTSTPSAPTASPPPRKRARATTFSGSTRSEDTSRLGSAGVAHRVVPTGHRRNLTSANLVPLDAPTQIRNYLTPSSTSKKEIPSAFVARRNKLKMKEAMTKVPGRKRSRDEVEPASPESMKHEDDDQLAGASQDETLDQETTSLLTAIEAKRRQNTLAARRSRQRKLDYVRNLEELLAVMTRERDDWKERAEKAEFELTQHVDD